jgi:hypothetical protein
VGGPFSAAEKKHYRSLYKCAGSGINSFTLFIEKSLDLLKDKGCIAYCSSGMAHISPIVLRGRRFLTMCHQQYHTVGRPV